MPAASPGLELEQEQIKGMSSLPAAREAGGGGEGMFWGDSELSWGLEGVPAQLGKVRVRSTGLWWDGSSSSRNEMIAVTVTACSLPHNSLSPLPLPPGSCTELGPWK